MEQLLAKAIIDDMMRSVPRHSLPRPERGSGTKANTMEKIALRLSYRKQVAEARNRGVVV